MYKDMILTLIATVALLYTKASLPPIGPPVQEVHKIAIEYAHIDMHDATQWKKRAKISAVLPRFQVDFANRLKNYVDVDVNDNVYVGSSDVVVGPEEKSYKESVDSIQSVGVRAVWSFNELIFSKDSLYVSREALNIMRERNLLLDAVNKHYFERKKLIGEIMLLQVQDVPKSLAQKKEHELLLKSLAMEKETAALDSLTGGWFSAQIE